MAFLFLPVPMHRRTDSSMPLRCLETPDLQLAGPLLSSTLAWGANLTDSPCRIFRVWGESTARIPHVARTTRAEALEKRCQNCTVSCCATHVLGAHGHCHDELLEKSFRMLKGSSGGELLGPHIDIACAGRGPESRALVWSQIQRVRAPANKL